MNILLPIKKKHPNKKSTEKSGSHKDVCLWYVGLLRCEQIMIADRKSAGDCFILFDKLELVNLLHYRFRQ